MLENAKIKAADFAALLAVSLLFFPNIFGFKGPAEAFCAQKFCNAQRQ